MDRRLSFYVVVSLWTDLLHNYSVLFSSLLFLFFFCCYTLLDASFSGSFLQHLMKCANCPSDVKDALTSLKMLNFTQVKAIKRGSKKIFLRMMWRRLHRYSNLKMYKVLIETKSEDEERGVDESGIVCSNEESDPMNKRPRCDDRDDTEPAQLMMSMKAVKDL